MQISEIKLYKTSTSDLPSLFKIQLEKNGRWMAAFTNEDSLVEVKYIERHTSFLTDDSIAMFTIKMDGIIIGSIALFYVQHEAEITYWLDANYRGQGIGILVLQLFLADESTRPLYARTAFDNLPSQYVLLKNGFQKIGSDVGFAHERKVKIEELIFRLD